MLVVTAAEPEDDEGWVASNPAHLVNETERGEIIKLLLNIYPSRRLPASALRRHSHSRNVELVSAARGVRESRQGRE